MPLTIWRTRSVTEALPKTYHQPIGPAISFGTGCAMTGPIAAFSPRRNSNQFPTFRSICIMARLRLARRASEVLWTPRWRVGLICVSRLRLVVFHQRVLLGGVVGGLDTELTFFVHFPGT